MTRIAIFGSGSGSNAENIIRYFIGNENVDVVLVLSNKPNAQVLERAEKYLIPTLVFTNDQLNNSSIVSASNDLIKAVYKMGEKPPTK